VSAPISNVRPKPDRVISVVALSDQIPARFISETLAQTLRAETGASVLLIHMDRPGVKTTLEDWAGLQPTVNGDFALTRHVEQTEGGIGILRVQVTDEPEYLDYDHFRRVTQLIHDVAWRVSDLDHRPLVDKPKPDPTGACKQ